MKIIDEKKLYGIPKRDGSGMGIRANMGRNPNCRSKNRIRKRLILERLI